jgi:hypothetical protein
MSARPSFVALLAIAPLALFACSNVEDQASTAKRAAPPEAAAPSPPAPASPQKATATPVKPNDPTKRQFGTAITETTNTPLTAIATDPSKFGGKTVRTTGVVTAVCKSMGCWMEIGDDKGLAHVQMAGHSFFVPRDSNGHHAVVQGKVLTEAAPTCGDGCREGEGSKGAAAGKVAKIEIEATGVELVD